MLFDEIEKAHPDVFNVFLQILDDGRLTDGQGRVIDFRNTIIIMTSNLGSDLILSADTPEEMTAQIKDLLKQHFRPEFLNRIDELLTFGRLGKEQIRKIVDIQLQAVSARLEARRLHLIVTDAAKDFLADIGYDPLYGARPLKRAIQTELENKLAKELLSGAFVGKTDITVDAGKGGLTFKA